MKSYDEISEAGLFRNLSPNSHMPSPAIIQNLYIPSDLDREFPLAPYYVQTFGSYPNYLHFNDDFKPSAQQLLDGRGFIIITGLSYKKIS